MDLKDDIEEVMCGFIDGNISFTAFNITEELRKTDDKIKHYQVRELVHKTMDSYIVDDGLLWTKERDFSLHPNGPFVYKLTQALDDLLNYNNIVDQDIYTLNKPDNRGRICIPTGLVRDRMKWIHQEVFVSKDGDTTIIELNNNNFRSAIHQIDAYYNIRISKKWWWHIVETYADSRYAKLKAKRYKHMIIIFDDQLSK